MIRRKLEEKVSNNVWCHLIFEEGVININHVLRQVWKEKHQM